jgi:hypothetical protein
MDEVPVETVDTVRPSPNPVTVSPGGLHVPPLAVVAAEPMFFGVVVAVRVVVVVVDYYHFSFSSSSCSLPWTMRMRMLVVWVTMTTEEEIQAVDSIPSRDGVATSNP